MTREISIGEIDDVMFEAVSKLVKKTTLEWDKRVKQQTPVDTGRLRNAWQTEVKPLEGRISNNVVYADRTRQGTVPGYPALIGKELEAWTKAEYEKIKRSI